MEFLDHTEFLIALRPVGVRETTEGDSTSFTLTSDTHAGLTPSAVVFANAVAPDDPRPSVWVSTPASALPDVIDSILHKEHLNEVALCPARTWGPIVDLVAFDLADDQRWNDIDAEVALHLHTRDPLMFSREDHRLVRRFAAQTVEHGEPGAHDLSVVAVGAPIVMNLVQTGRLTVWCGNPAIADVVAGVASPNSG